MLKKRRSWDRLVSYTRACDKRRVSEIDLSQPRHETAFWWRHNRPVTSQLTDPITLPNYPLELIGIYVHINTQNKESMTRHFRFSLMSSWSCFHSPALIQPLSRASCCLDTQKSSSWFWITSLSLTGPLFLCFGVSDTCINTYYLLTLRGVQHGGLPGHWPGRPCREYHKGDTKCSETSVCEVTGFTQQVGQW